MTTEPHAATDVNELFNRDPLSMTDEDIDKIIMEYRKRRQMFNAAPASAAAKTKTLTDKEKAVSSLKIELDL